MLQDSLAKYGMLKRLIPCFVLTATLAGCGGFGAIDFAPFNLGKRTPDAGATPSGAVQTAELPTAGEKPTPAVTSAANAAADAAFMNDPGAGTRSAATTPTGDLARTDLLGGWTVASGTESCQLFMTLTSWTGGYRASTRGCNSDALKSISAWSLNGKQVVLAGAAGKPVAYLQASDMNHFNGQLDGQGQAITFYR